MNWWTKKTTKQKVWTVLLTLLVVGCVVCGIQNYKFEKSIGDSHSAFREAMTKNDYVAAQNALNILYGQLNMNNVQDRATYHEYADELFNAKFAHLCANNAENDEILLLLTLIRADGSAIPAGTKYYSMYDFGDQRFLHERYIEYVSRYNQKCNIILNYALAKSDETLARSVISLYKDTPSRLVSDGKGNHIVEISNPEREQAKQRLEDTLNPSKTNITPCDSITR